MASEFPDSVRVLGSLQFTGDVVGGLIIKGKRVIRTVNDTAEWDTAEKAILHDLYNDNCADFSVSFSTKFREMALGYQYHVQKSATHIRVYCHRRASEKDLSSRRKVGECPLNNDRHNMQVDLMIVLDMMKTLQAGDVRKAITLWPYGFGEVFPNYDANGEKMPDSPEDLPRFIWDALCGKVKERQVHLSEELAKELAHLHAVLRGSENQRARVDEDLAVSFLQSKRIQRLKYVDRGVRSKKFMSVTPWAATTFNKFYVEEQYDLVIHPGSGCIDRLSNTAFVNTARVFCIDPRFDDGFGKITGVGETWESWMESNPVSLALCARGLKCWYAVMPVLYYSQLVIPLTDSG